MQTKFSPKFILGVAGFIVCLSSGIFGTQGIAEEAKFSEDGMAKNNKRDIAVSVRNTRPPNDHHRDARECLKGDKNEDIVKCAQKFR